MIGAPPTGRRCGQGCEWIASNSNRGRDSVARLCIALRGMPRPVHQNGHAGRCVNLPVAERFTVRGAG